MISIILYVLLLVAGCVPGLPVGWRLFGRRHPAGWIAGALLGYLFTTVAIWIVIRAGVASGLAFSGAWLVTALVAWFGVALDREPVVRLDEWHRRDLVAYGVILVLTLAVAIPPFARLGMRDAAGNQRYRAYFTADFVWHTALTAEVGKFSMPPRNPFMRHRPVHYYWTYFLVPAAVSSTGPAPVRDVEGALKVNAIFTALLFVSAIFVSVRAAVSSATAAAVSVALALVASSAEGAWALWTFWTREVPFTELKLLNVDAVSSWWLKGYRVDGLQRAIWYNPQHSMAGALGLIGLAAAATGSAPNLLAGFLTGLALAGSVMMNPFVGGLFSLAYGITGVVDAVRKPDSVKRIACSAAAAVPVLFALAWIQSNGMVAEAGNVLQFGFFSISRHAPLQTLVLSLGPALLPVVAGLLFAPGAFRNLALLPAAILVVVSLFLMYFLRLSADEYWVGFRTGHLMLVAIPVLSAAFFASGWKRLRPVVVAVGILALITGVPTFVIDAYNAQDIRNVELSPGGFPWTRVVTPDEQDAFRWIREHTPPTAIVQEDALSRYPDSWWVVPTFGQRRMAAAVPPFLIDVPEYHEQSKRVQDLYAASTAADAWSIAHALRIGYIYVDHVERQVYGDRLAKFEDQEYFAPAFRNAAVQIYKVK